MKVEIAVEGIGENGIAYGKMKVTHGGFDKEQLPEEYIEGGDYFYVRNHRIIAYANKSPISGKKSEKRTRYTISLNSTYSMDELNRMITFMQDAGTRLTKIKERTKISPGKSIPVEFHAPIRFEV